MKRIRRASQAAALIGSIFAGILLVSTGTSLAETTQTCTNRYGMVYSPFSTDIKVEHARYCIDPDAVKKYPVKLEKWVGGGWVTVLEGVGLAYYDCNGSTQTDYRMNLQLKARYPCG